MDNIFPIYLKKFLYIFTSGKNKFLTILAGEQLDFRLCKIWK